MSTRFRKVSPHQLVEVKHDGLWLGGELEAWLEFGDHWRGLVKIYLPAGASKHKWALKKDIAPLAGHPLDEGHSL